MQEWTFGDDYTFKVVDQFEGEEATKAMADVFKDGFPSVDTKRLLSDKENLLRASRMDIQLKNRYRLRIAVFHKSKFVGWTSGWEETDNEYYMASSGILAEHRKKGLYSQLVSGVLRITKEQGFLSVHSHHLAANNAVIVPKLRLGFTITGMELMEWVGLTVKTVFYHQEGLRDVYNFRVGMKPPTHAIREILGYN